MTRERRWSWSRLGITEKLWLSMLMLTIVVMVPVGVALDRSVRAFYVRHNAEDLIEIGSRYADFVSRAPGEDAAAAVRAVAEIGGIPLLLIDDGGKVVVGSAQLQREVGQQLHNPEILQALAGEPGVFLAGDPGEGRLFVTAVPVYSGTDVTGAVVLFRSAGEEEEAMRTIRRFIVLAAFLLVALSSLVAWFLSRWLTRPLLAMTETAEAMAAGNYRASLPTDGADELHELADAINLLGSSLHALEKGRRQFFANVSHELRTPLSYVQGYADALADGKASSLEESREYGRILAEESRRLSGLVDDLFELARAEEGHLALHPAQIRVRPVVDNVVDRIRARAAGRDIDVSNKTPDALEVYFDPYRIEQIILNLLDNALRYTPEGGRIHVRGGWHRDGAADWILVTVEDSGPGFGLAAGTERSAVFERFYRGEKSRNRHLGGAGMGLAIVKSLVEAGGGWVEAGQSTALGGARVTVALPAAAPDVSGADQEAGR